MVWSWNKRRAEERPYTVIRFEEDWRTVHGPQERRAFIEQYLRALVPLPGSGSRIESGLSSLASELERLKPVIEPVLQPLGPVPICDRAIAANVAAFEGSVASPFPEARREGLQCLQRIAAIVTILWPSQAMINAVIRWAHTYEKLDPACGFELANLLAKRRAAPGLSRRELEIFADEFVRREFPRSDTARAFLLDIEERLRRSAASA